MAEEAKKKKEEPVEKTEEQKRAEQKIMCFVSKQMVPLNETIELAYAPGKKVRVLPKYIKYDIEAS